MFLVPLLGATWIRKLLRADATRRRERRAEKPVS